MDKLESLINQILHSDAFDDLIYTVHQYKDCEKVLSELLHNELGFIRFSDGFNNKTNKPLHKCEFITYKEQFFKEREMQKKNEKKYCEMCCNASVCPDLTEDNDGSSYTIGKSINGLSMFLSSGMGKPVNIQILQWNDKIKQNQLVGLYEPNYCPNCGRKLTEYKKVNKNENNRK